MRWTGCAFKACYAASTNRRFSANIYTNSKCSERTIACDLTRRVHQSALDLAKAAGRPYRYSRSTNISKEELIDDWLKQAPVGEGLVGVLSCVEPCSTYKVYGDRKTQKLALRLESSRCLHLYFYVQHPHSGWIHLRLQTWFPFLIHNCLNSHERLARRMDHKELRARTTASPGLRISRRRNAWPMSNCKPIGSASL